MDNPLPTAEGAQALRAAEGAMLFLRDRTARPDIGLSAAVLLLVVMCRTMRISREGAHALLDGQWENVHELPAPDAAARPD